MCYFMVKLTFNVKLNVSNGPKMDDKVDFLKLHFIPFESTTKFDTIYTIRVKSFILVFLVLMK